MSASGAAAWRVACVEESRQEAGLVPGGWPHPHPWPGADPGCCGANVAGIPNCMHATGQHRRACTPSPAVLLCCRSYVVPRPEDLKKARIERRKGEALKVTQRPIQHPLYKNISMVDATQLLTPEDVPVSAGQGWLAGCVMWYV